MARDLKGLLKFCFKSGVLYVVENIAQRMRGKGKIKKMFGGGEAYFLVLHKRRICLVI